MHKEFRVMQIKKTYILEIGKSNAFIYMKTIRLVHI